jgi:precorrin-3B C17-methyltransferase
MYKLYVVGLGPGGEAYLTGQAKAALAEAKLICGYSVYTDLLVPLFPEKPILTTPMTQEIERCRMALKAASEGQTVAMVCSGDGGVYGMASLIYQLSADYPTVEIEVVSGVTAALSGAAVLGAPLSHDFAVISLSDLLTPLALIEKRLALAAEGDFCIALYNPASKKRADYLRRACDILLRFKARDTVCGWVRNIGREGQTYEITTLDQLNDVTLDMFCTVFIGNTETQNIRDKMVTPRGYEKKL